MHPSWILDSIKAGTLLPVDQYLLYHGRKAAQKVLNFTSKPTSTCTTTKPTLGETSPTPYANLQSPQGGPSVDMTPQSSTAIPASTGEPLVSSLLDATIHEESVDFKDSETARNIGEKDVLQEPESSIIINEDEDFAHDVDDLAFRKCNKDEQESHDAKVKRMNDLERESLTNDNAVFKKPGTRSLPRAGDANFVSEFYNNSRLHYLSTWGAEFKKYTSDIIKSSAAKGWKSRGTGRVGPHGRVIMHIDMDSFFVSVTLRDQPHLRGKPIAVCHAGKNSSAADQGEIRLMVWYIFKQMSFSSFVF